MRHRYDTLLFDLDGTLTDSARGIHNSFRYALKAMGCPEPTFEQLRPCVGPPLRDSFRDRFGIPSEKLQEALDQYQVYYADRGIFENEVYPGIRELLDELSGNGITLAVASSKKEIHVKRVLEHFDLMRFFAFAGGSDDAVGRSRKEDVVRYVLESLGVRDLSQAALVGDRMHDAIGAAECGIDALGALWGYGTGEELTDAGVVMVSDSPSELGRWLLSANV